MRAPGVVASPVLVGRDDVLALADRRLAAVAAGRGHVLFVSGEAGIGKTRFLTSVAERAEALGFRLVRASAFPGDAEVPGGLVLDLASDLRRSEDEAVRAVGAALVDRLRTPAAADGGDRYRHQRLLVRDLTDTVLDLDAARPTALLLEDLHWADELSLEVVRHLAARVGDRPTVVVGSYRSHELVPRPAVREWRAQLVNQRRAEEIRLARLTPAETATLTSALLGRSAPAQVVAAVHERSDGIPLHVEELLAAAGDDATRPDADAALVAVGVPETLADAVLVRAERLGEDDGDVVAAAAVIGRSFDFDLLVAVTGFDARVVDRSLRSLRTAHLVHTRGDGRTWDFRHALIRDALYADVPTSQRRRLHARVAEAAVDAGYPHAFVSAHFDEAGYADSAYRHALAGAAEAVAVSAHREALALYRRALRHLPPDVPAADQARLLVAVGREAAAVDENAAAVEAFSAARARYAEAKEPLAAAAVVAPLVSAAHLLGEGLDRRAGRLRQALAGIDGVPDADPVRAQLLTGLAAAYMLDRRLDEAIEYGEQSRALSRATGDEEAELNTAATLGSVLLFAGRLDEGWAMLEDAIERSTARLLEAEAARTYRMIGSSASVLVEYDRAEHWLTRGAAYADAVELWNHRCYMNAHLAHVRWAVGQWAVAEETAEHALADGRGGVTTTITAQCVLGYLALGRGDWTGAAEVLGEALEQAEAMAELQRVSPAVWGLAETALLRGDLDRAVALSDRGYELSERVTDAAYLFPFVLTGLRARLGRDDRESAAEWVRRVEAVLAARAIPGTLPALAHARGLLALADGDLDAAATALGEARAWWAERRRFWEGTWAELDLARCTAAAGRRAEASAYAKSARAAAEAAGAEVLVTAADELARSWQSRKGAQPWDPLTEREFSVARLVAEGLTNREIAERLVVSPKTVGAHVEHILTKLGAARRAEIAAWAAKVDA